jgi:hypothetical protein
MAFWRTSRFKTAPYFELIEKHGMKPRHHLMNLDDTEWVISETGKGMRKISSDEALQLMATDALVWLRDDKGLEVEMQQSDAVNPAGVLRRVRDVAVDLAV